MLPALSHSNGVHHAAANAMHARLAVHLKRRPLLVNELDRLGVPPLAYAVLQEDVESIKVLLECVIEWWECG
jgi:hypothetical protein